MAVSGKTFALIRIHKPRLFNKVNNVTLDSILHEHKWGRRKLKLTIMSKIVHHKTKNIVLNIRIVSKTVQSSYPFARLANESQHRFHIIMSACAVSYIIIICFGSQDKQLWKGTCRHIFKGLFNSTQNNITNVICKFTQYLTRWTYSDIITKLSQLNEFLYFLKIKVSQTSRYRLPFVTLYHTWFEVFHFLCIICIKLLMSGTVFARMSPDQKTHLIQGLQNLK